MTSPAIDAILQLAQECGATVYRNRANPYQPAVAFGDESWAKFCAVLASHPAPDLRQAAVQAREALRKIGEPDAVFPETRDGYSSMAVVMAREALASLDAVLSAPTQQSDSGHLAAPSGQVASPAPRLTPGASERHELPRTPSALAHDQQFIPVSREDAVRYGICGDSIRVADARRLGMLPAAPPAQEQAGQMVSAQPDVAKIEQDCLSYAALSCLGSVKQAYRLFYAQGKTAEDFDRCAWDALSKAVKHAVSLTAREVRDPVWPYAAVQQEGAAPKGPTPQQIVEAIAKQWDGCMTDIAAVGEIDIGETIRRDGVPFHLRAAIPARADAPIGEPPAGYKLVPLELARRVAVALEAGCIWAEGSEGHPRLVSTHDDFRAMLAAAPSVGQPAAQAVEVPKENGNG
jgi:hypothetical protein